MRACESVCMYITVLVCTDLSVVLSVVLQSCLNNSRKNYVRFTGVAVRDIFFVSKMS
jgi:hypothetical protein